MPYGDDELLDLSPGPEIPNVDDDDVEVQGPPSIDSLRAQAADEEPAPRDRKPGAKRPKTRGRSVSSRGGQSTPAPSVPMGRPGQITKSVNLLYRKAGKFLRAWDPMLGAAVIDTTYNDADEGDPDNSVGAAWEAVAKVNPHIRAFLQKLNTGNAYAQLFWAHAPILLAVMMKDSVQKHLPFANLLAAFGPDDEEPQAPQPTGNPLQDIMNDPEALRQAMAMAQQFMPRTFVQPPDGNDGR